MKTGNLAFAIGSALALFTSNLCLNAAVNKAAADPAVSRQSPAAPVVASPVTASIAGLQDAHGKRLLNLRDNLEVDIVVRNVSDHSVGLTTNGGVVLTVSAVDGKSLPKPILVYKSFLWANEGSTSRHRGILGPGDVLVSRILLHQYKAGESRTIEPGTVDYSGDWLNFPAIGAAGSTVRLQADYSGYKSEARDYQVTGPY